MGVPPDRGIVRFVGVAEEYLATNGVTILGEIENLSKNSSDDSAADSQSRHSAIKSRASRRAQMKPKETPLREHGAYDEGAESADDTLSPLPSSGNSRKPSAPQGSMSIESAHELDDNNREKVPKRLGKRKSFLALFGKWLPRKWKRRNSYNCKIWKLMMLFGHGGMLKLVSHYL